jgi:lipid II:glycine glycyltransferase (peptidoglycan interpeptide bridge formation enzyme)
MANLQKRELGAGYKMEVDTCDEATWYAILEKFEDASIYQTWTYAEVIAGKRNTSHVILKKDGEVVAVAQARIAKLPLVNAGIAYIHWGPLWRCRHTEPDLGVFQQALRALQNEFACRRGLVLRLFPILFDKDSPRLLEILKEEGFSSVPSDTRGRTILMDLSSSLEDLREGMGGHWKRELKSAERRDLEVLEGSGEDLFAGFVGIYKEMVSRKKFVEPNDIHQFQRIQSRLPEKFKMRIMLCKSGEDICAGNICSVMGNSAIYLFGATSNAGMKSGGSYLLHWKFVQDLKRKGMAIYNLNGINPTNNPGTYKFKKDLAGKNGKDVYYFGRFDSRGGFLSYSSVVCGEILRAFARKLKGLRKMIRGLKISPKPANG